MSDSVVLQQKPSDGVSDSRGRLAHFIPARLVPTGVNAGPAHAITGTRRSMPVSATLT